MALDSNTASQVFVHCSPLNGHECPDSSTNGYTAWTYSPTSMPSYIPSNIPSNHPTSMPSSMPSSVPSSIPSNYPTTEPSQTLTVTNSIETTRSDDDDDVNGTLGIFVSTTGMVAYTSSDHETSDAEKEDSDDNIFSGSDWDVSDATIIGAALILGACLICCVIICCTFIVCMYRMKLKSKERLAAMSIGTTSEQEMTTVRSKKKGNANENEDGLQSTQPPMKIKKSNDTNKKGYVSVGL